MKSEEECPCKSGRTFGECCGPIIAGMAKAASAEALMRARYSSYATGDVSFLKTSAVPKVQDEFSAAPDNAVSVWMGFDDPGEGNSLPDAEGGSGYPARLCAAYFSAVANGSATTTRSPASSRTRTAGSSPTARSSARRRSRARSRRSGATTRVHAVAARSTRSAAGEGNRRMGKGWNGERAGVP